MNLNHFRPARLLTGSKISGCCLLALLMFLSQVFLNFGVLPTANAATIAVANGDIAGLVKAINSANASNVPSTIQLAAGGTYTFSTINNYDGSTYPHSQANVLPAIKKNVTINGNGATIERNLDPSIPFFTYFYIASGGDLKLNNLTVRNGQGGQNMRAITNHSGTLSLHHVTLKDNVSGGIFNISDNEGDVATLNVTDSFFLNNSTQDGGAIANLSGSGQANMVIRNSTFAGNRATSFGGGAITNEGGGYIAHAIITNVTFYNNSANSGAGSAIYNLADSGIANLEVNNSTFYRHNNGVTILSTRYNGSASAILHNNLFSSNASDCLADQGGKNLEFPGPVFCPGGVLASQQPLSGELGDYGGPTPTIALAPAPNPAVGLGDAAYCPATDQRGAPRVNPCTVGAIEFGAVVPVITPPLPTVPINNPTVKPANPVGQLRVTPDRVASIDTGQEITFNLLIKNIGPGTGRDIKVIFPVDPDLVIGYASFIDPKAWVSEVSATSLTITLPGLDNEQEISTTLVFRVAPTAQVGKEISARAIINFSDDGQSNKISGSNMVRFSLGAGDQARNDSGGAVQYFSPATIAASNGTTIHLAGDFYSPGELVTFWYTSPDNTSQPIGSQVADDHGVVHKDFTPDSLVTGATYSLSGQGQWSGVTGSALLTILAAGTGS